jgi:Na+:H+ antiporter, NhaA family
LPPDLHITAVGAARIVRRPVSAIRRFLASEAAGGLVLMAAAALALVVANSPTAAIYFAFLHVAIGPLTVSHWINDGLMAVFFLLVGLEIKREVVDGELSSWRRRLLPGFAAIGGMIVPALIYAAFNSHSPGTSRGWAVPTATDIAFALGVLSLLGRRVPASLKVFLAALAIIDDLGAVVIIALFYTSDISIPFLAASAAVLGALMAMNRSGVLRLWPYLVVGAVLWIVLFKSGVHSTIAGVLLALTIPIRPGEDRVSPLHVLEHALARPVAFIVVPVFGFANAGVSFAGMSWSTLANPLTAGIALGLLVGKLVGVFGATALAVRLGLAAMPHRATWTHLLGLALLCGIGFTMSLFIGLLAFEGRPAIEAELKIGILGGSLVAGLLGFAILRTSAPAAGSPETSASWDRAEFPSDQRHGRNRSLERELLI